MWKQTWVKGEGKKKAHFQSDITVYLTNVLEWHYSYLWTRTQLQILTVRFLWEFIELKSSFAEGDSTSLTYWEHQEQILRFRPHHQRPLSRNSWLDSIWIEKKVFRSECSNNIFLRRLWVRLSCAVLCHSSKTKNAFKSILWCAREKTTYILVGFRRLPIPLSPHSCLQTCQVPFASPAQAAFKMVKHSSSKIGRDTSSYEMCLMPSRSLFETQKHTYIYQYKGQTRKIKKMSYIWAFFPNFLGSLK